MAQQQIKAETGALGSDGDLQVYQVPGSVIVTPYSASAVFDGSGAAGSFIPCLTFKTQTGAIIARCPAPEVAAGDTAEVSWFPHVAPGSPGVTTASPTGSGVVTIPATVKLVMAVLIGGGGGGGGGSHVGLNVATGGGTGGGGGGVQVIFLDATRLRSLYPSGVAYSVGLGGAGGAGGASGTTPGMPGADGQATTFGFLTAGGGGGGLAAQAGGSANLGGGGGALTSAVSITAGAPFGATGGGVGIQSGVNVVHNSGACEYGGAPGGGLAAISLGNPYPGDDGGCSLYGGCGGGSGAGIGNTVAQLGGKGGSPGVYRATTTHGNSSHADGTFSGLWTGSGGDGGDATSDTGALPPSGIYRGNKGAVGSGGGGGGGSSSAGVAAGDGGKGGDGRLILYLS